METKGTKTHGDKRGLKPTKTEGTKTHRDRDRDRGYDVEGGWHRQGLDDVD